MDFNGDGRIAGDDELGKLFDTVAKLDGGSHRSIQEGTNLGDVIDRLDDSDIRDRRVYADKAYKNKFKDQHRDLEFQVKELRDLIANDVAIREAAAEAGVDPSELANSLVKADLDRSGTIVGPDEMASLFQRIDGKYDHDGHSDTFLLEDTHGKPTLPGAVHSQLGLIAENREARPATKRAEDGRKLAHMGHDLTDEMINDHWEQIQELGFGTHYGSNSDFNWKTIKDPADPRKTKRVPTTWKDKMEWVRGKLEAKGLPATDAEVRKHMPRRSSCIEFAMEGVERLYNYCRDPPGDVGDRGVISSDSGDEAEEDPPMFHGGDR